MGTNLIRGLMLAAALASSAAAVRAASPVTLEGSHGDQLGTVRVPDVCSPAAHRHLERGLALLHHMTYDVARAEFTAAAEADPECPLAYWGSAMTHVHPLWSDPPDQVEFEQGQAWLQQARSLVSGTGPDQADRIEAYIEAAEAYYAPGWSRTEQRNLQAFAAGWREAHRELPDDPEVAAFHALAHLATADPEDKRYRTQRQAAEIAKGVLEQVPDHPGAHHYVLHAYDYPPLAHKALDVARSYATIAPEVPHALHMPGHIFTRLGLWQESIDLNRRSAEAALRHGSDEGVSFHYLHALDYLAYAYLQRADNDRAEQVLATLRSLQQPLQPHPASAYALAAVPARLALERQDWERAASLPPRSPADYPWDEVPAMEAITHFARALGAVRSGSPRDARQAINALAALRDRAAESSEYWADQIEIQRLSAQAWLDYQQGNQEQALETMRHAAGMEAATEKHPITPGEVLPATELLADMLLDMGRYQAAQREYRGALERTPNRFNSLYGMARAAELAGDHSTASRHYAQLVEQTAPGAERDRLQHATAFLQDGRDR